MWPFISIAVQQNVARLCRNIYDVIGTEHFPLPSLRVPRFGFLNEIGLQRLLGGRSQLSKI